MQMSSLRTVRPALYESASSLNRRTVLRIHHQHFLLPETEGTNDRTVAAAVVETVHAPPAVVFLHALQCQIPTAVRLTES